MASHFAYFNSWGMHMHRLRLLLLLSLMFAVGGTAIARAQDGTTAFNDQDQKSGTKHNKVKKNNDQSNVGHRKHWYSPPHWLHKKHNSGTSAKSGKTPSGKTVAANTTRPSDVKPLNNKSVATTTGHKTTTATGQHRKTVAANRRRKRPVTGTKNGCTPEQAKKGGCTTDKSPGQKGAATASAAKPS